MNSKAAENSETTFNVQKSKKRMENVQPLVPMKKIEKKPLRKSRGNPNSRSYSNPYNLNFATTDMSVEGRISKKEIPKNEYNSGSFLI